MAPNATPSRPSAVGDGILASSDVEVLGFVAEMSGVQLDQLAAFLADNGEPAESAYARACEMVARWREARYAESAQLTLGEPWVWATRRGLDAFGLGVKLVKPAASTLRHSHAVTDVRLAVERTSAYRLGGASWFAERRILAGLGFPTRQEHIPDGEVRWPADGGSAWAGQIWAIEVEISRKTIERIAGIMYEALTKTGEFGSPPGLAGPGQPPRYARLVYICSASSVRPVLSARAELGAPLSARIDVYDLPESAMRLNTPKRGWEP
jgi:hypothetical protein